MNYTDCQSVCSGKKLRISFFLAMKKRQTLSYIRKQRTTPPKTTKAQKMTLTEASYTKRVRRKKKDIVEMKNLICYL